MVRLLDGDYVDRMYVRPPQENLDWLIEGRLATVNTFADLRDAQDERGIINYCTREFSEYGTSTVSLTNCKTFSTNIKLRNVHNNSDCGHCRLVDGHRMFVFWIHVLRA